MTLETRLLGAADRLAAVFPLFEAPLRGEELVRIAQRRTGLTDFGDTSFEEPLDILLRDYNGSAHLTVFGRLAARWDALRFLINLLMLREEERLCPAILDQAIDRPIFITGMPRSGSSFLLNLLAQDSNVLTPLCWQTIYPCPLHNEPPETSSRRIKLVDRQLSRFFKLAPEVTAVHPLRADSPQECSEILAHIFQSRRFETTHQLADYPRWLDQAGDLLGYQFHKRFLQHLQYRAGPRRWVLKCPEHVFSMRSIRTVYPDASFVFMHRDPVKVLRSVAKLTEVLRRPFSRRVDPLAIGRQVSECWLRGAALLIEAKLKSSIAAPIAVNVRYRQLIEDPLATVQSLYRAFGIPLSEETMGRFRGFVARCRNGGYARISYRAEEFGFDAHEQAMKFRDYFDCFAIERENANDRDDRVAHVPKLIPAIHPTTTG
jgi:Sulfotransferase family